MRRQRIDRYGALLYQIIGCFYPAFRDVMTLQGKSLPRHKQQDFSDYTKCGRYALVVTGNWQERKT